MSRQQAMFWIVDAGTRRPVRKSRFSAETVRWSLYRFIGDNPHRDFLIVDENYRPVPVSAFRSGLRAL